MFRPELSVSRIALITAAIGILTPGALQAADVTVAPGDTLTGQQTFGGTDKITVGAGATLTSTSDPTLKQTSNATGVVIDNAGTIQSTGATSRAIRFNTGTDMTFTLTNEATGVIQSATSDAFQVGQNVSSGTIVINNYGTIQETGVNGNNGQALDFGNVVAGTAKITINNYAGGLIQTADSDAIRPAANSTINNYGSIISNNFETNSGADGIDFQTETSGTVNNYKGGVISGGRHGINISFDPSDNSTTSQVTVFNDVGGTIIGRNGSGVGSDVSGTVVNYGTISGRIDSIPGVADGDGDGVDIDYTATITNYGLIEGTGAKGVGSDGLPNTSQGVSIGAGTVVNKLGAVIRGQGDGILVDNSSEGPAFGAVTITNAGTIEGTTRYGIFINSTFDNTIANSGTITGGNGQAIVLGAGNDTLNIRTGSVINGTVDGGAGTDKISLSGTGTFAGAINFETLSVDSGFWTLTGPQSYANGVNVANGAELNAAATIDSAVTVAAGGRISGIGTLGSLDLSGTLAPGNSIGTLTVAGNAIFRSGSIYEVQTNAAGQSDKLVVGGLATLGGTVQVLAGQGNYAAKTQYTILTATGGVSGQFDSVSSNLAFLTPTLAYDANDAYLTLSRNSTFFRSVALTNNERGVGAALDQAAADNPLVVAVSGQSAQGARTAYDSFSGEGLAAAQNAAFTASHLFTSAMQDQSAFWRRGADADANGITTTADGLQPLAYAEQASIPSPIKLRPIAPRAWRAWFTGFGGGGTIQGSASLGTAGETGSLAGGAFGLDYQLTPNLLVGVSGGGSDSRFSVSQRGTSGEVTGAHGGIYSMATYGASYLQSSFTFSSFDNRTKRAIASVGPLNGETENGRFGSREIRTRIEAGRTLDYGYAPIGTISVTPFAALEIAKLWSNGFSEQAGNAAPGALALGVASSDTTSVPGFLGVRLDTQMTLDNGMRLLPVASVAYVHEFSPERTLQNSFLSLPAASFIVDGARPARDAAEVKVGAQLALTQSIALYADFEGEFSGISTSYAGKGGLRVTW